MLQTMYASVMNNFTMIKVFDEKKNPENHIVGFLRNLFANYGGK